MLVKADKAKAFMRNYGEVKNKTKIRNGNIDTILKENSFPSRPLKAKMVEMDGEYVFIAEIS